MRLLSNGLRKLFHWVGKLLFSPEYLSCEVKEFPQQVDSGVVYVVREGDEPDTLIFRCPCGCADIIYLNLLKDTRPCWEFKINLFGLISIDPSIRRKVMCKSHFYLTKGRVIQCSEFSPHIRLN